MNSFLRRLLLLSLASLSVIGLAHGANPAAQAPQELAAAGYPNAGANTPDNGAIRRANPNSRQGTESISPNLRGPNLGPSQPRPPTLENGGIGNGYPTRQASPRPSNGTERRSN